MKEIWERIENWLRENYPEGLGKLKDGASEKLIRETEDIVGVEFPTDVKEFYKIHNGENHYLGLFGGFKFLTLEKITTEWLDLKDFYDEGLFDDWKVYTHERLILLCQVKLKNRKSKK